MNETQEKYLTIYTIYQLPFSYSLTASSASGVPTLP